MSARENIMEVLRQHDFATPAQLAALCGVNLPTICKAMQQLTAQSLIVVESSFRPTILRLSCTGARVMDTSLTSGKRMPSASVQQHACHRNEVGLVLAQRYPGFQWTPRLQLLQHGLRPAIGEHGATDGAGRAYLVLLDDYVMAPNRILRTWQRRHAPDPNHTQDPTGQRWCDLANHFIVATTSEKQTARHQRWMTRYNKNCSRVDQRLPDIDIMTVKPLWTLF